jgi:hypothetical protein
VDCRQSPVTCQGGGPTTHRLPLSPWRHAEGEPDNRAVASHLFRQTSPGQRLPGWQLVVKEDEASRPGGEALSRFTPAEVCEGGLAKLVEETRRLGNGAGEMGSG